MARTILLPRKRALAVVLALVACAALPASARAQETSVLNRRVRVTLLGPAGEEPRIVGTATALRADTLTVATGGVVRPVSLESIRQLDVSRGRRGHALTGALVGAGIGVVAGLTVAGEADGQGSTGSGVIIVPLGAALYGGLGALIGSFIRRDRWEPVSIPDIR